MLAYANMAIDAIQNSKTQFLSTFVTEKSIQKPLQAFVDAQTAFTKQVAKTASELADAVTKYDYSSMLKAGK